MTEIGMKSYNPFPIIHRCKYDFNFEKSSLKARTMGHMEAAKTIIVVSHSSALISEMATEAIWLHRRKVKMQGDVETITEQYLSFQSQASEKAQLLSEDHDDS